MLNRQAEFLAALRTQVGCVVQAKLMGEQVTVQEKPVTADWACGQQCGVQVGIALALAVTAAVQAGFQRLAGVAQPLFEAQTFFFGSAPFMTVAVTRAC